MGPAVRLSIGYREQPGRQRRAAGSDGMRATMTPASQLGYLILVSLTEADSAGIPVPSTTDLSPPGSSRQAAA
jgi:hypothetical protein